MEERERIKLIQIMANVDEVMNVLTLEQMGRVQASTDKVKELYRELLDGK